MLDERDMNNQLGYLPDMEDMLRIQEAMSSSQELMSRYRCALMEVETKFKVLN